MSNKRKQIEIHGKNELTKLIIADLHFIYPQLEKFLNKKISTLSGRSSKFNIEHCDYKPISFDNGKVESGNYYFSFEYNTLKLHVKICLYGGKYEDNSYYCEYFEKTIYLGKIDNSGVLTKLDSIENIILTHDLNFIDLEEQLKLIAKYKELEKELSELRSQIKISL